MITQVWNPCALTLLNNVRQCPPRCGTPAPLHYWALWGNDHTVAEPLCLFTIVHCGLLCTVGSDYPGVEPLCPFTTEQCWALITQVWYPCALLLMCTIGSVHPGKEPLCPPRCGTPVPLYYCHSTVHCGTMITQVWNPCAPLLILMCTVGSDHPGVEPLNRFTTVTVLRTVGP